MLWFANVVYAFVAMRLIFDCNARIGPNSDRQRSHRMFANSTRKLNVLMIIADDMRPEIGAFYNPKKPYSMYPRIKTPNLNSFAVRSLLLRRAYAQQAICAPSRVSLLTSRRPDTTKVYTIDETYWRDLAGNLVTIPQFFKNNGYRTVGIGKIFHHGSGSDKNDPPSWSEEYRQVPKNLKDHWNDRSVSWRAVPPLEREAIRLPDDYVADEAVKLLKEVGPSARDGSENFFAAVGFYKPHLPFVFPRQYLDLYPENEIELPRRSRVPDAMPDIAWNNWEISKYPDIAALNLKEGTSHVTLPANVTRQLRRAYYGAVSYVDHLVGRVVRQLDVEGLRNNTVVVFLGDHGWHLGESNFWGKHTNFELATWAPLIISIPGMTPQGIVSDIPVEFVDLFPTVVEAAGFSAIPACPVDKTELLCTEGESLLGLIPGVGKHRRKHVAFSQYPRRGFSIMGYSVRTDRFRYTEWIRKKRSDSRPDRLRTIYATELYDHFRDPDETTNRFNDSAYADQMVHLRRMLQAGWRGAVFPDLQIPGLRQQIRHATVPPSRKRSGHPFEDLNSIEPNESNFEEDSRSYTMEHEKCSSRRDCKRKFKRLSKFT